MGRIAFAAAASHAPGLIGMFDQAPQESQEMVSNAYGLLAAEIRDANLDLLIIVANDHMANNRIRAYPDFLVGLAAEHRGPFEFFKSWLGCEDYVLPGDPESAEVIFNALVRNGVKASASRENLNFDDNVSVPTILTDLENTGVPVIPVLQNCTVPPMPDQHRSYEIGQVLARAIKDELPSETRVGILASGGLSHEPGGLRDFYIDEEFDKWFLDVLVKGDHAQALAEVTPERMDAAGIGGTSELFCWFLVMGAIGERRCDVLGYTAYDQWRCGIGAVRWDLS